MGNNPPGPPPMTEQHINPAWTATERRSRAAWLRVKFYAEQDAIDQHGFTDVRGGRRSMLVDLYADVAGLRRQDAEDYLFRRYHAFVAAD